MPCILCKGNLHNKIFHLSNMPSLVQNMPRSENLDKDKPIDLDLYQCDGCGLVQFSCAPVYYYKDVIRAVGLSDTMKKLRISQYQELYDRYNLLGKKIWEVGCGGGEFLQLWKEFDVDIYGIENNDNLVRESCKKGLKVSCGFVDADYRDPDGPFDVFVSFNYLEHQPDPSGMVSGIYNNLTDEGIGLVTVPSFEYFIEKASYYEFMRDHIAYYTEEALTNLFQLNGFRVLSISRFNGDTTQIIVQKRKKIALPDFDGQKMNIERELNTFVKSHKDIRNIAVWGASHQALTLLATLKREFDINYIIDSSPKKTDCYSPVSHIQIKLPDIITSDAPELIIIMAPAFSNEITKQIRSLTNKVKYILAIKDDKILYM